MVSDRAMDVHRSRTPERGCDPVKVPDGRLGLEEDEDLELLR
jgi:hypothetical protein